MSALGSLVVKLALEHAEYTQGLDKSSQEALKFAKNWQDSFDRAGTSAKEFMIGIAAGAAGAVASVVGIQQSIQKVGDSINLLASINDAAEKTGSSVADLSRIEQVSRNFGDSFEAVDVAIGKLSRGLAGFKDPTNDAIRALDAIGVSTHDSNGELRKAADVYIEVAKSLQQYEDGAQKTAVANALFGKSGVELIPAMNNLAAGIDNVRGVSAETTLAADDLKDAMSLTRANVDNLFLTMASNLLPTLGNIIAAINGSSGEMDNLSNSSGIVSTVLKGMVITGYTVIDVFKGVGREIGGRVAQLAALARFDFKAAGFIGDEIAKDSIKAREEYDKFIDTVLNGEKTTAQAVSNGGTKKVIGFQLKMPAAVDAATRSIEKQAKAFDLELYKLKQYDSEAKRARDITDSVATKQERYNETLEELERLKPYLSVETYTRALEKAERELQDVGAVNKQVTSEMDQLWVQAGRNIQSVFANSIFDFFNDGLKSMVGNVINAVGRIASEFASLRIAQAIGLSSMFGIPGTASAGGVGGAGTSVFDIASLGSNALSLASGGFGVTSLIGGGIGRLGGLLGSNSLSAFGGGFAGDAIGGLAAGGFSSGAASAASMGASVASVAGPLAAAAITTQVFRMLAGDKRMGGGFGKALNTVGDIPILGDLIPVVPLMNALFGHGPMKFRQQSLQGTASSDGFDGDITNVFRAKGGLFVKNKHKPVSEQLSLEQQTLFDTALSGFYGSAHNFAENLGLSTDLVDNFTAQVQIKSEKGKTLTEDAITDMLKGIGNSLAQNVLPMVDTLRKAGEDSFATMTRLNNEFVALTQGAENLGASVGYAKEIIRGMTFEARTAFIDAAGGIDSLSAKTQFFADNFLTAAERLAPASQRLAESMQALGLSSDITKEQFKALVQSYGQLNSITENQLQGLLSLAPAFVAIKNAQEQLTGTTNKVAESERSLNDVRQELLSSYNKERGELESTISKFKSVSDSLRSFRDSLSLGQLSPLTPGQKLEEARAQFNRTRLAAAQGDQSALESLSGVSQEFLQASQTYNASSAAFISDFNLVKGVLDNASQSALSQSEIARNQLTALDKSVDYLVDIQTNTKTTADLIREINIKSLTGSGNAAISTKDIQGFLSANPNLTAQQIANAATKYGVSGQQLIDAGVDRGAVDLFIKGSSITDKQILDFVNSGASPRQIYDAAVANGVSSTRLSTVTGISKSYIDKIVKDMGLPSFDKGTDFVAKTGLAMVHRAEAIVPSSTTEEIKKLREELAKLRQEQNQQTGDLIKVTDITSKQNADTIAEAITVIDKNRQWNDRAMVRLA